MMPGPTVVIWKTTFGDPSMSPRSKDSSAVMDDGGVGQFPDRYLALALDLSKKTFSVSLENLTSQPIKLDWNNCSFVDADRQSHRVIHSGVKFVDRELPMAPLTIPPGASYSEILTPSDHARLWPKPLYWQVSELLPEAHTKNGKCVTVFMPLVVGGVTRNYSFRLKIHSQGRTVHEFQAPPPS
jgi:hypothetical protein